MLRQSTASHGSLSLCVGRRLQVGFASILILTIVLGMFSVNRLSEENGATTELATNWLAATRALGDFSATASAMRRAQALLVIASSLEDMAAQ